MKFFFNRPTPPPEPSPSKPEPAPAVPAPVAPAEPAPAAPAAPMLVPAPAKLPAAGEAPAYRQDHRSLYKQLLHGLYDAVLVADPKGHVIDSSARVQNAFQFDSSEVWDMPIHKLISGITPSLIERVQQGVAESRHVLINARCVRKDGSTFAAEVAISSIDLMNKGDLVFSVRNVDRRKRQSQLLHSLQNALANNLAAVAVCDHEAKIVFASQALRTLWACAKDEDILGKPLVDLWPKDPQAHEPIQRAVAGQRWTGLLQATACNGRAFTVTAAIAVDHHPEQQDLAGLVCSFIEASKA